MGREFESVDQVELDDVTPEQVWDAIATGPGIDSWFMGHNEVEPGVAVRSAFGGYRPTHPVTAWEPGKHLAYGGEKAPDGRFVAYEFLIEGRDRGSTVLRMVTSGFLPGDDWEEEYQAMLAGGEMFRATLVEYLRHFAGRTATPLTVFGPPVADWGAAWTALGRKLGLDKPAETGDRVRLADVDADVDAVVYFANAQTVGVRTEDALYRFFRGVQGGLTAMHHFFTPVDADAEQVWASWLGDLS